MDQTLNHLKEILKDNLPDVDASQVTRDSVLLTDLGLDSLNMMLLAIVVEDAFHIHFQEHFAPVTVGDLCAYIEAQFSDA